MSRPFSYNDENFTVIGNILFVHFADSKEHKALEPVIQIPDEIYKRMVSFGNTALASPNLIKDGSFTVSISVILKDNIPYIAFTNDRFSANYVRYHYAWYLLKDI